MPHIVDQLQAEAATAIAAMRDAALFARRLHARAELLRHMQQTAVKLADQPPEQAIERVVREWMQAWHIDTERYVELLGDARRFAAAFCATRAAARRRHRQTSARRLRHWMRRSSATVRRSRIRWRGARSARMAGGIWWCPRRWTCPVGLSGPVFRVIRWDRRSGISAAPNGVVRRLGGSKDDGARGRRFRGGGCRYVCDTRCTPSRPPPLCGRGDLSRAIA